MFFVSPSVNFEVTHEEFILFHSIHRRLFTRLVVNLDRDPSESMQVMALWLWLERARHCRHLVYQILPLPLTLVDAIAEEAVVILSCIEHDNFPPNLVGMEIELTRNFALNEISLGFFHGIRVAVICGVTQLVKEVCSRAFHGILEDLFESNKCINHHNSILGLSVNVRDPRVGHVPYVGDGNDINFNHYVGVPRRVVLSNSNVGPRAFVRHASQIPHAFSGGYDLSYQHHILGSELSELLENITLDINEVEEDEIVPADDRTIFLTFSKGYPITQIEVHNFIIRRYGRSCIEAIYMQDVLPNQQALYARLVVKNVSTINLVLGGRSRAKFSINGKHVWARKYVKRQTHQAHNASTSSADADIHN